MPDGREFPAMVLSTQGTRWANERWCSYAVVLIGEMIVQCLIDKRDLDGRPPFRSNHFVHWQGRGNEFKGMPIVKVLASVAESGGATPAANTVNTAGIADSQTAMMADTAPFGMLENENAMQGFKEVPTATNSRSVDRDEMPTADPEVLDQRTLRLLDANLNSLPSHRGQKPTVILRISEGFSTLGENRV